MIRDKIQNVVSRKWKRKQAVVIEVEKRILSLETSPNATTDQKTLRQLAILQTEYHDIASATVKQQILVTQHKLYETGDKAGKLLAWLSRRRWRADGSIK